MSKIAIDQIENYPISDSSILSNHIKNFLTSQFKLDTLLKKIFYLKDLVESDPLNKFQSALNLDNNPWRSYEEKLFDAATKIDRLLQKDQSTYEKVFQIFTKT